MRISEVTDWEAGGRTQPQHLQRIFTKEKEDSERRVLAVMQQGTKVGTSTPISVSCPHVPCSYKPQGCILWLPAHRLCQMGVSVHGASPAGCGICGRPRQARVLSFPAWPRECQLCARPPEYGVGRGKPVLLLQQSTSRGRKNEQVENLNGVLEASNMARRGGGTCDSWNLARKLHCLL